jgi:hypothetical protein
MITAVIGAVLILSFFIPHTPFRQMEERIPVYFDLIAAFAFILGGGNLLRVHLTRITQRGTDWLYSLVTVGGFLLMLVVGLTRLQLGDGGLGVAESFDSENTIYMKMYHSVFDPCQSTMFSLLAFFVASASYRAFRAKNLEATILLLAAFVILLGRTFIGEGMTAFLVGTPLEFLHIPNLSNWIMAVPNLAGQRTIMIGISLGIVSTSLRLILGIERAHLGGD